MTASGRGLGVPPPCFFTQLNKTLNSKKMIKPNTTQEYLRKLERQKYLCEKHLYNLNKYEQDVVELAAELFKMPTWAILAKTRWQKSCDARKAIALVLRDKTSKKLTDIGDVLSVVGYDHTTILHSIQTGINLYQTDDQFKANVDKMLEVVNDIKVNVISKSTMSMKIPVVNSLQALYIIH